jgi:ParB-like chromosome segregation protein Spo0J
MKLTDIKPNPRNPRTISEEKLEKLKNSIIEMPKGLSIKPMIVDEDNIIIGGNQRYLALVELGYDEIPDNWVKKVIDLTEDEKKRFLRLLGIRRCIILSGS